VNIKEFIKENRQFGVEKYESIGKVSAVYSICNPDGEIVYIGKSDNLVRRMSYHEKVFDGCLIYFFRVPYEILDKTERRLIREIKPKLNSWLKKNPNPTITKHRSYPLDIGIINERMRLLNWDVRKLADEIGYSISRLRLILIKEHTGSKTLSRLAIALGLRAMELIKGKRNRKATP
jgi:hypothetical protein